MNRLDNLLARYRPHQMLVAALSLLLACGAANAFGAGRTAIALFSAAVLLGVFGARATALRLLASQAQIQALLAPVEDVILMVDRDGRYLNIAPTNPCLLVRPPSELVGRCFAEVLPHDTAELFLAQVRRTLALAQNITFDYELPIGARTVCFTATLSPVDSETVVWVARDITARKMAERALQQANEQLEAHVAERTAELSRTVDALHAEVVRRRNAECALRRSEESYRNIVEQASDITCTLDAGGTIVSLNAAFERTLGYRVADWIGRPFRGLVAPHERQSFMKMFNDAINDGGRALQRNAILHKDGSTVTLETALVAQRTDGAVTGFLCVARDVTARERDEARLRESEERFRFVARATNDAVWDLDLGTGKIWWSEGFSHLFGHEHDGGDCSVDHRLARIHPEDRTRVEERTREAIESGQDSWADEYRFRRADGSYAIAFDRGYIVRDSSRRAIRVTGAMADLTERRLLEEQLAHTRRVHSLGRVAASIAHEFNNVLMGIQPNLEIIRRRSNPELSAPLDHVLQSVLRGKRVTDEILRFTRPAQSQLECVNVKKLITSWETEMRVVLGRSITLDVRCDSDELFMAADPMQVTQVLTNLAVNARDAMPEGGTLQIHAELGKSFTSYGFGVVKTPDGYVHLTIRDSGTGMTRDQLSHVFEPLFTTKRGGTGLGLAISYQLVMRHGGQMFVESEKGIGTTFHVLIPATHPIVTTDLPPQSTQPFSLAVRRITIVEDEPAVASGLKTLLELDGAFVDVVGTGREALRAIERFAPDVVVLDIGLPDIDGTEVYAQIEKHWPEMPVLFSSGHADAARLEHLLTRSNLALLLKPYEFDTFRRAIDPLMRPTTTVV